MYQFEEIFLSIEPFLRKYSLKLQVLQRSSLLKRFLNLKEELLLFFIHIGSYFTEDCLEWLCNLSQSDIHLYLDHCRECFNLFTLRNVFVPNIEQRLQFAVLLDNKPVTMVIDGVEQPCIRHDNDNLASKMNSAKKHNHTVTKLVAVCPSTGKSIKLFPSSAGVATNMQLFIESYQLEMSSLFDSSEFILADKGFQGSSFYFSNIITPYKKLNGFLTEREEEYNLCIKKHRIIVENYFAMCKKFAILGQKFRTKGSIDHILYVHNQIWNIISYIVDNYKQIR